MRVHSWPDCDFQLICRGEVGDFPFGNFQRFSVLRVADSSGFAVGDSEGAEAGEGDAVAFGQGGLDALDQRVQGSRCLGPGELGVRGDFADQIFLIHGCASCIKGGNRCQFGIAAVSG